MPSTLANDVLQEADDRGYKGLSTRRDAVRTYPGHDVAANLVGFMGTDKPYGGLEEVFDKALSGKDGSEKLRGRRRQPDPARRQQHGPGGRRPGPATTIDRDLQWYTQRVLRQAVEDAGGESGIAVVMDSRTGEILALADDPTFDADDPAASPVGTGGPARSTCPTSPARSRRCSRSPRSSTRARSPPAPRCWCPASCTARTA